MKWGEYATNEVVLKFDKTVDNNQKQEAKFLATYNEERLRGKINTHKKSRKPLNHRNKQVMYWKVFLNGWRNK